MNHQLFTPALIVSVILASSVIFLMSVAGSHPRLIHKAVHHTTTIQQKIIYI